MKENINTTHLFLKLHDWMTNINFCTYIFIPLGN